jgi:hypothetical protein
MIYLPGLITGLVALVIGSVGAWKVQAWRYDTKIAEREAQIAQMTQEAEAAARRREQALQQRTDQVAKDAARRQTVLAARAATSDLVARSLLNDITRLNARPGPTDPAAARYADDAARARQLLGACAEEYRGVALSADRLRDQVIGLQGWASGVVKP